MQNLADIVMGTVQYNEEGVLMSIKELCGVMTNESEAFQDEMEAYNRLVKLAQVWKTHTEDSDSFPLPCTVLPPGVTVEPFSSPWS